MKTTLRSLLLLIAPAAIANAALLTVDNRPGSNAMFDNFADAYAAAAISGDTILLAGSGIFYGSHDIHKQLTIVGPGFLHSENSIPGTNTDSARIELDLENDPVIGSASGTMLIGITGGIEVVEDVTGVVIDKCASLSGHWVFRGTVTVSRCFTSTNVNLSFSPGSSGSIIRNSIIENLSFSTTGINADRLVITNSFSGEPSTSISNGIFVFPNASNFTPDGTSVTNCMAVGFGTLPAGGGNINGELVGNVFLNTGSPDGKWMLKAGSPAIGTGTGGSDMGAFGGPDPYVPSGIPGIPRITRIVANATATSVSGLRLEIDAQAFAE